MGIFRTITGWFWTNLGNLALVASWLMSATIPPWVLSWSEWANSNPILYLASGVVGVLAFWTARALYWRGRIWMAEAKFKERLMSQSSAFDPMASVYQGKRLHLRDLAPPGRREVKGKTFKGCEIIGPGNIVVALRSDENKPYPKFVGNTYYDVDCIQIQPGKLSNNAIYFGDCDFDGCQFYNINLMFFERNTDEWHWITRIAAEAPLLEDKSSEEPAQ